MSDYLYRHRSRVVTAPEISDRNGVPVWRIDAAIERLIDIGLGRIATNVVDMDLNGSTLDEHLDWILSADADEIRGWAHDMREALR